MMERIDFSGWVRGAETAAETAFRQAIHTLIKAVSRNDGLRRAMIFHGGLLLAIRFQAIRHTRDIDFVTEERRPRTDGDHFIALLNEALVSACELLPYVLDCRIQSWRINPPGKNRNFQSMKIVMGYAYKGSRAHKRLVNGASPTTLEIDYSFNEINQQIDTIELAEGGSIRAYSLVDQVAEKYRAIVQQKVRNRRRRQDAFDIFWLLEKGFLENQGLKKLIHQSLIEKARSRNIDIHRGSLADEDIIERSRSEYGSLADEIDGELPEFDMLFRRVREYYEALPWGEPCGTPGG